MPLIKASLLKWRRLTEGFAVEHGAHGGSMMTWRILFMLEILQSTINTAAAETNESGITFAGGWLVAHIQIHMSRYFRFQPLQIRRHDWCGATAEEF